MDEFAPARNINWNGHVGTVDYGNNQNMVVMFYNKAEPNPAKSNAAGRPIFEDKVFVRIHPPGERLNIVDREADESHKRRYPIQWRQFQEQKQQIPEGTPIDLLYPDHPSVGATLRAHGVYTIEQCADLSANAIETIGMGAQTYVNTAKNYLSASNKGVKAVEFRKTIDDLQQQNKLLERQVEQLKGQLDQVLQQRLTGQDAVAQIQSMLAGQMQRPQYMPNVGFDPAVAQINATHGSSAVKPARKRARAS